MIMVATMISKIWTMEMGKIRILPTLSKVEVEKVERVEKEEKVGSLVEITKDLQIPGKILQSRKHLHHY